MNTKGRKGSRVHGTHRQRRSATNQSKPITANDESMTRLERLQFVPLKFLRFGVVRDRTGLSRSTIWRLERRGDFPKHRQISPNTVGWIEQEIDDWMQSKVKAS